MALLLAPCSCGHLMRFAKAVGSQCGGKLGLWTIGIVGTRGIFLCPSVSSVVVVKSFVISVLQTLI